MVSTCGVMFASRPEATADELARVCRKGGRIALTTWLSDSNLFKMFQVMTTYRPPPPNPGANAEAFGLEVSATRYSKTGQTRLAVHSRNPEMFGVYRSRG